VETISIRTGRREEFVDVTDRVRRAVGASGVGEGICLLATPHTTCAVTVNEGYDPDVVRDAIAHLRELVPHESNFQHAEGNSDSHIKAMLVGNSTSLPVSGGELRLGRWQGVFLCEFDGPRDRELQVTVVGGQ
jgi:secondary thiamine-phosphate synthase enzyme